MIQAEGSACCTAAVARIIQRCGWGVDTVHIFDEGSRHEVVGEIQHETGLV